jgi:GNAT superfamily N-acetyltransferase
MADLSVRPALPGDAAELGRIQVDTWRTAYGDVVPPGVLDRLTVEAAADRWAAAITSPPSSKHHVLVALEQEWRVGFVALGPADDLEPDDLEPASTLGLALILVEPRWGRRGHGSRLLAAAIDHARADGMTRAIAWLPEGDTASRNFLVSAGWGPDGLARALDTGAGELREIRLQTVLADG